MEERLDWSRVEPTRIYVLKIGGRQLDDPDFLAGLAETMRRLHENIRLVLVHGGGKTIQ